MAGSGGIVQRGRSAPGGGNTVYLVEGPETGATLAATVATEKDTVIASLSIGNKIVLGIFCYK